MGTPLQKLEGICAEIYSRWDADQRSGKLLGALAGGIPGYRQDVTDVRTALDENERLRQRVEALEHLIVEECDPTDMSDIPNAMLAQTARDAVARRATEAFSDEQSKEG